MKEYTIEQIFKEITVYPTSRIKAEEHCKIYPAAIPFDYRMGFQAGVEWLKREVLNRMSKPVWVKARKIYVASKTKHAQLWKDLRDKGLNIISTWIDEAGKGETKDMADLCRRCIAESAGCDVMIVYSENGDYLKGAFIEMGVAIHDLRKTIILVGDVLPEGSAFTYCQNIIRFKTIQDAIEWLDETAQQAPEPVEEVKEDCFQLDKYLGDTYDFVDGDWYWKDDKDGECPLSTYEVLKNFHKQQ